MRHPLPVGAAALAVALLAAGCGSNSPSKTSASSTPASTQGYSSTQESTSTQASTTATPAASVAAKGSGAALVSTKRAKLGTELAVGKKRLTVYLFEGDKGAGSACYGACAKIWPPVTTSGAVSARGAAKAADLGTITRTDGTKQVTYKGHPLYFFIKDHDDGDSYGQGIKSFGAEWYVLAPSGKKIDQGGSS